MIWFWSKIIVFLWWNFCVLSLPCPRNEFSVDLLEVFGSSRIDASSQQRLSITAQYLISNHNANDINKVMTACIDLVSVGDRFCGLDPALDHLFGLPSDYLSDQVHISYSLCHGEGLNCFCSENITLQLDQPRPKERTQPKVPASHFSIFSPQPNQTIVTDALLTFVQTSPSFVLGSSGSLCIEFVYKGGVLDSRKAEISEFQRCFDHFPEDVFPSTNSSLLHLMDITNGHWDMIVSARSSDGSLLQQELVSFMILRPDACEAYSNHVPSLKTLDEIRLMDSTLYFDGVDDMLIVRLGEHAHELYQFLVIEANESHNGTARTFSLPKDENMELREAHSLSFNDLLSTIRQRSMMAGSDIPMGSRELQAFVRRQMLSSLIGNITENDMAKECQQRDGLSPVLRYLESHSLAPDYVYVSDTDELLHRSALRKLRMCKVLSNHLHSSDALPQTTIHFLHHFSFNFNFKGSEQWGLVGSEGAYTTASGILANSQSSDSPLTPTRVRRLFRPENRPTLIELAKRSNIAMWKDNGWHMSGFRSPAEYARLRVYYPGERNPDFFTEEHCTMLMDLGISAYELHRSVDALLEESSREQKQLTEDELPVMMQHRVYHQKYYPTRTKMTQEERRSLILYLQNAYKQTLPEGQSSIVFFQAERTGENFLEFTVGCVQPTGDRRLGDRDEIDRVICCSECLPVKIMKGQIDCTSIYEYADYKCALSSNDRVGLTLIAE